MDFLPDGRLLVTERTGRLQLLERQGSRRAIGGLPTDMAASGQAGLLDVAISPAFEHDRRIYLTYVAWRNHLGLREFTTCVLQQRLNLALGVLDGGQGRRICARPWKTELSQFGGALALDPQGYVFVSVGDRAQRQAAQNPANGIGKIWRLNANLRPPLSNPFGPNNPVWSLGHRNPQGLFLDGQRGVLYEAEHGPRGGDEINTITAGKNYGWPVISYGREYESDRPVGEGTTRPGMEPPLYYYVPSIATSAITGYRGTMFPEWRGSLFVGALAGMHLSHLYLRHGQVVHEERLLHDLVARIRDVKAGPEGALYVLLEQGELLRLSRPVTVPSLDFTGQVTWQN